LEEVNDEAGHEHGDGVVLLQVQLHQLLQLQREFRLQHMEVTLPMLNASYRLKKFGFFQGCASRYGYSGSVINRPPGSGSINAESTSDPYNSSKIGRNLSKVNFFSVNDLITTGI
jgi:hypothetical protein